MSTKIIFKYSIGDIVRGKPIGVDFKIKGIIVSLSFHKDHRCNSYFVVPRGLYSSYWLSEDCIELVRSAGA